jgi:hypothetical protein
MRTPTPLLDRAPTAEPVPPRAGAADRRVALVFVTGLLCGALLVLGVTLLLSL